MAFLRIMTGERKGQKFDIDRDDVVLGRAPENVVSLDDPSSSSHHCAVLRSGRRFTIKDLGSTNGTRLNNIQIKEYRLSPKDVITVGSTDILFDGGDEVEAFQAPSAANGPQVTVRLGPATGSPSAVGAGFGAKKDSKVAWIVMLSVIGILILAAVGWFVKQLLSSKPPI